MLHFLLLVATPVLGCGPEYAQQQTTHTATYTVTPESWSPPSTKGMECMRGYSTCWPRGSSRAGCTNEFSVTNVGSCTRYSVNFIGAEDLGVTGVVIDNHSTVREHDKNFDKELWNNTLTPTQGCAVQYRVIACDHSTSNCSIKDVYDNHPRGTKTPEKTQECHGYFVNAVVFDSKGESSDDEPPSFTRMENGQFLSGNRLSMASMTVAWTTTLPNKQCMAAYNVCWRIGNTAYVGCQRSPSTYKSVKISGPVPDLQRQLAVDVLSRDEVKCEAPRTGAAGHVRNSLIIMSTTICLLRVFTTLQI